MSTKLKKITQHHSLYVDTMLFLCFATSNFQSLLLHAQLLPAEITKRCWISTKNLQSIKNKNLALQADGELFGLNV